MKDLTISLFGLVASLMVVAALVYMELEWEFAFYSVMHLFIIPTGAIVSGMGAAAGYYLGALFLNTRPSPKYSSTWLRSQSEPTLCLTMRCISCWK